MTIFEYSLPASWRWTKVSDHFRVTKKPYGFARASVPPELPFVPMAAVPTGGATTVLAEDRPSTSITSGNYFERGDMLLSRITPSFENLKQAIASEVRQPYGYASTELIPIQPLVRSGNIHFLFYYVLHPDVRDFLVSRMEGATGRQRVPERAILDLRMPEPPLTEQARITAVLSLVQRAIETEEKSITATRELKRAALARLFVKGLRDEQTSRDTEIGPIPSGWEVRPLADLREFLQYGTSTKCDYGVDGNPVLRIPNIAGGRVDPRDIKRCQFDASAAADLALQPGDVLFIRTNGVRERVGTCAVYEGDPEGALFASYLIRARVKPHLNPQFLQYYTETSVGASFLAGRSSPAADGKFNVNTKTIDSVLVPLPPIDEQDEIVRVLRTIDESADHGMRRLTTLRDLFASLLDKLMTGEIRVDNLDIDTSAVAAA